MRWVCGSSICGATMAARWPPDDETMLEDGDTLVLSGIPENLSIAEQKLLQAQ
jgi:K+/H+ antiporter YhaU regulatory subunit KhtT